MPWHARHAGHSHPGVTRILKSGWQQSVVPCTHNASTLARKNAFVIVPRIVQWAFAETPLRLPAVWQALLNRILKEARADGQTPAEPRTVTAHVAEPALAVAADGGAQQPETGGSVPQGTVPMQGLALPAAAPHGKAEANITVCKLGDGGSRLKARRSAA